MQRPSKVVVIVSGLVLLLAAIGLTRFAKLSFQPMDEASVAREQSPSTDTNLAIRAWHSIAGLDEQLAQFETVFWEPDDTTSMRDWLKDYEGLADCRALEIGTGTGLISLSMLLAGAGSVVATDINPHACRNAQFNADRLGLSSQLDVRRVPEDQPGPFVVMAADERFDLIVSNPPWEAAPVEELAAYAFYDPDFQLLDALLTEAQEYLAPQGRLLLAYGAKTAIRRIQEQAPQRGWKLTIHDTRDLNELPEVFLPGMLLELQREAH